jgi:hypothetical protein
MLFTSVTEVASSSRSQARAAAGTNYHIPPELTMEVIAPVTRVYG